MQLLSLRQAVVRVAMASLVLLPVSVAAQTTEAAIPTALPAVSPAPVPAEPSEKIMIDKGIMENGEFTQPPLSAREKRDFIRQFKDLAREATQLLKQLKGAVGADEIKQTLQEVVSQATGCVNKMSGAGSEEQREVMNECQNLRLWDSLNEVREEFVPPQEIKNVLREIQNQVREITRFKKQLARLPNAEETGQLVEKLLEQMGVYKKNIAGSIGRDQREAIRDYYDAQMWEEVNKIRARIELPRELKQITRELAIVQKLVKSKSYQAAFKFFNVDEARLATALAAKQATVEQIQQLVNEGNAEEAFMLLEEDVHRGWHPGDIRGFTDMLREGHQRLRGVRDTEIKEQVLALIAPIVEVFNEGDYRAAREAMQQFVEAISRYERLFQPYYRGGEREIDDKTAAALERLEQLIQQKLQKTESSAPSKVAPAPTEEKAAPEAETVR